MTAEKPRDSEPAKTAAKLTGGRLLARNAVGNVLSQILPMAVALLSMPWIIRGLGTDRFGVMTLAWMVLGYFSLFDLGLGRALTQAVAEKLGRDEVEEIPGLVWTALALMAALGTTGGVLVALGTPWLVGGVLRIPPAIRHESYQAFLAMAAALPCVILTAGFRGVLEAYQRFGVVIAVRMATSLAVLLAPLAVLPFTNHLGVVVGVVAVLRMLSCLAHAVYCLRTVPSLWTRFTFGSAPIRPLLTYGGWMTAVNIINPLMVQMDRFLIAALVSTAAVAYYTTPWELITRSWFLSGSVIVVAFPAFATSYVADRLRTVAIFDRCLKSVALILFPVALGGVTVGREVLLLWIGADFADAGALTLQLLSLGVLCNGLAQVPSALIQGIGRPDLTFKAHFLELLPYLAGAVALTSWYGIEGAALAWSLRCAADLALYLVLTAWVLPEGADVARATGRATLAAVGVLALAALPLGAGYRYAALVVGALVFAAVAWSRLLNASDRALIGARLGALGGRFRATVSGRPVTDGSEPVLTRV